MTKVVKLHMKTPTVQTHIDKLREQIALRAQQIAGERMHMASELENWLAAERQLVWKPDLRLEETAGEWIAKFRLPGLAPDAVKVYLEPQGMVLMGEAACGHPEEGLQVHGDEFRYGQIYREVGLLTGVEPKKAKAELSDGLLVVTLPKLKTESEKKPAKPAKPATPRKRVKPKKEA